MNKKNLVLMAVLALFLSQSAFAVESVTDILDTATPFMLFVQTVPMIGHYITDSLQVVSVVAMVMTAVSTCAQAILGSAEIGARISKAPILAAKIKAFSDRVLPFLKYASIYNVQKKRIVSEKQFGEQQDLNQSPPQV